MTIREGTNAFGEQTKSLVAALRNEGITLDGAMALLERAWLLEMFVEAKGNCSQLGRSKELGHRNSIVRRIKRLGLQEELRKIRLARQPAPPARGSR